MNQHNVWIKGSFYSAKSFADKKTNLIKSGLLKTEDFIMQGYKPEQNDTGILYSWHNMPIGYYDVPTLNNMVFSGKLWMESMHENQFVKAALQNKAFYGEDCHRDNSEIFLENVVLRVDDWWKGPENQILADVSLLDTPKGLIVYNIAKSGMVGTSSRGFGDLIDIGNGLTRVDEDSYLTVSQDAVCFPAVPSAFCLNTANQVINQSSDALQDLEKGLREQITSAIEEAYEKNPTNDWIAAMFNSLHLADKSKTFPLASSVSLKNRYPSVKAIKNSIKKYPSDKDVRKLFK
jgi:hypothetical protein